LRWTPVAHLQESTWPAPAGWLMPATPLGVGRCRVSVVRPRSTWQTDHHGSHEDWGRAGRPNTDSLAECNIPASLKRIGEAKASPFLLCVLCYIAMYCVTSPPPSGCAAHVTQHHVTQPNRSHLARHLLTKNLARHLLSPPKNFFYFLKKSVDL